MNLLYRNEFISEKEFITFIKNVEKLIRGSIEYKEWIGMTRDSYGTWKCAITGNTIEQCSIEIHHHPYTLFDLVYIVIFNQTKQFCSFSIAEEVMRLHFDFNIGFIPLITTIHEQYHSGNYKIPTNLILGNYKNLEQIYKIPGEILESVWQKLQL